jgi:hypothetical protein
MSATEVALLETYKKPLVPLADICREFFGLTYKTAKERAALNQLPVSTWRLIDTPRAPLMVRVSDLAERIDARGEEEHPRGSKSQI